MQKTSLFQFSSYKTVMRQWLRGRGQRGVLSRAAEALNCQRSYLSRVINSSIHLTPDQAFGLARFLRFSPEEQEYFQTLVDFERAGDRTFRDHLQAKIREQKRRHESLAERTKRKAPDERQEGIYFSAWYWSAIHFLTSVKGGLSVEDLSQRLSLPKEVVSNCLSQLEQWDFVRRLGQKWEYVHGEFHLPKQSPFIALHHQNWRSRAVLDAQNPANQGVHYTTVQTLSFPDFEKLKELVLKFISESDQLISPSLPEEGVVLTLDMFRI